MTAIAKVSWENVLAWRMRQQFLDGPRAGGVRQVVQRLTTVPARSGDAELAVGLRLAPVAPGNAGSDAVAVAFAEGQLIKTFAFRGATHYFVPEDVGVYLALRSIGRQWELKSWREFYQLDSADWPALRDLVSEALAHGPLSQSQLADSVATVPRFRHLAGAFTHPSLTFLKPFAWQGDLSLAPSSDGQLVVRSLRDAPGWGGMPGADEAGPRAILAYLEAYGPATATNLQYWFGEGLSAGRKNIVRWTESLVGTEVGEIEIEGTTAYCLLEHVDDISRTSPRPDLCLLPGFDQWVLGPGTADPHVVPADDRAEITRGANLVVIGGRVEGTWTMSRDAIVATRFDGAALPSAQLEAEVKRIGAILGRSMVVQSA